MAGTLISNNTTIKVSDGVGASYGGASQDYTVPANSYVIISSTACSSYASGTCAISISGNATGVITVIASYTATGTTNHPGGIYVGPDEIIRVTNSGVSNGTWIGTLFANTP